MKQFSTNKVYWALFTIGSIACAIASYHYFPQAFPIVHIDITMDRTEAIKEAKKIANSLSLGPSNGYTATSFATNEKAKTFVELEGGGKEAFISMMDNNYYQPYTWQVRLFKPYEQHEVTIGFTPDGKPYEFSEQLSENEKRKNISSDEAQKIAQQFITSAPWNIALSDYHLVETSQDKALSGRIDHTFVYERTKEKIGEGLYRLSVKIGGNRPSKINHYLKEPESFTQRYQAMRSKNENIAYLGTLLMIILYGLGCASLGLFYLIRKRMLIWKQGFMWASVVAFGIALTMINKLPLYWMKYNTSYSPTNFLMQLGVSVLYNLIFLTLIFTLVFITAEGLTRIAFPNKIQFWRLFNPSVLSSYTVLGYAAGAYLLVPYLLFYVTAFYLLTTTQFGWWTPSSSLFDPNILATYFPWLESVAISFQAGFLEECLFRALPLSCAAILGKRYGKKNWWIASAFLLQIFIFGAAHANYPAQPSYARLIELIFFSTVFGGIYLRFGLLPSIISHFAYDVFLFALPLFASSTAYALWNKSIVIALSLIPLFLVLKARLKNKTWNSIPEKFLNRSWRPQETLLTNEEQPSIQQKALVISKPTQTITIVLGLIALATWVITSRFTPDNPKVLMTRTEVANATLDKIPTNQNDWHLLINPIVAYDVAPELHKQHRFIWQQNHSIYKSLIGNYIAPPHWVARLAKFSGPLDARAEEHQYFYGPDGSQMRYLHKLSETQPGASLEKEKAISISQDAIERKYSTSRNELVLVTAQSKKHPKRLDWLVSFTDRSVPLSEGEARIKVQISGDEVTDMYRYVQVPEDWEKKEENRLLLATIISKISQLLIYLLALFGTIFALLKWSWFRSNISLSLLGLLLFIFIFEFINSYPTIIAKFITSQPFGDQLFRTLGISFIVVLLRALVLALMVSFVTAVPQLYITKDNWRRWALGISIGIIFAAVDAGLSYIIPPTIPQWANLTPLRFLFPFAVTINSAFLNYLTTTVVLLFAIISLNSVSLIRTNKLLGSLLFLLLGFIESGLLYADNLPLFATAGIINGLLFALFYYLFFQWNYATIPLVTMAYLLLGHTQEMIFGSFSYASYYHLVACIIIILTGSIWYKRLN